MADRVENKTFDTPVKVGRYSRDRAHEGASSRGAGPYSSLSLLKQNEGADAKSRAVNLLPQPVVPQQSQVSMESLEKMLN